MKKRLRHGCIGGGLLALLAVLAGGFWGLGTSGGARCLLTALDRWSPFSIQAQTLEGRLADELRLKGLRIAWPGGAIGIRDLDLAWQPGMLLQGRLEVVRLAVDGFDLELGPGEAQDAASAPGPESSSPKPPSIPPWLEVLARALILTDFAVVRDRDRLFHFSRLAAKLELKQGRLDAAEFEWISPYVLLAGHFRANLQDLSRIVLTMQADVGLPETLVDHGLFAKLKLPTEGFAELEARGTLFDYRGPVRIFREDGHPLLSVQARGTLDDLRLEHLAGHWLGGELTGDLFLDWAENFQMAGAVWGAGLDPGALWSQWPGQVNLALEGELRVQGEGPLQSRLSGTLDESLLRGRRLFGAFDAQSVGADLRLDQLELNSDGLELRAAGRLAERLNVRLDLQDLGPWVTGAGGRLMGEGWLRWRQGYLSGEIGGRTEHLSYRGGQIRHLVFEARHPDRGEPFFATLQAENLARGALELPRAKLSATGLLEGHDIRLEIASGTGELKAQFDGAYVSGAWRGRLQNMTGGDRQFGVWTLGQPAKILLSGRQGSVSQMHLTSDRGERLEVEGDFFRQGGQGSLNARWEGLNLGRLAVFLPQVDVEGKSSGRMLARFGQNRLAKLAAELEGFARLKKDSLTLDLTQAYARLDWNQAGLNGNARVETAQGALLGATLTSGEPAELELPEGGELKLVLENLNLKHLQPWLPEGVSAEGVLQAEARGQWHRDRSLAMAGLCEVGDGRLRWGDERGQLRADMRSASLRWDWREDRLLADLLLKLADYGALEGKARLPLVARLPLSWPPVGAVEATLDGNLQERGLLAALFPHLVQETQGQMALQLRVAGSWRKPVLAGHFSLADAGGYLPASGIRLQKVGLSAELAADQIDISALQVHSGPGSLQGEGLLLLDGIKLKSYRGTLSGHQFQVYNYPELQALIDPELSFEGDLKSLAVRGTVKVPTLLITGAQSAPLVRSSSDLEVFRPQQKVPRQMPMELDAQVKVVLGEHVLVQTSGGDARLTGELLVGLDAKGKGAARGKIRVAEGRYSAYGARLMIKKGILSYQGGPPDNPMLDIVAVRDLRKVQAGVHITGNAESPEINLFSRPSMAEKDILGYIFLGRAIRRETDLLLLGAGTLVPTDPDTLRGLGVSEIDLQGLFSGEGGILLRYNLADRWELESTLGLNSGLDLFYVIEFR